MPVLTNRSAEAAKPKAKPYRITDQSVPGFHLRIQPTGYKAWKLEQGSTTHTLGRFPQLTYAMAKECALRILRGEVEQARAPAPRLGDYLDGLYGDFVRANHSRPGETLACIRRFRMNRKRLDAITQADVEQWRIGRQGDGVSAKTINRDVATLKAALERAVEWSIIDDNPLRRIKPLRVDRKGVVRFLEADEEARLFRAMEDSVRDDLVDLVTLAMHTGLRRGELMKLRWADADLKRKTLTVRGQGAKSGQTRHVPLNDSALGVLRRVRGDVAPMPKRRVFVGGEFKKSWTTARTKADLLDFRFHDLRHTFASRLVMAGVPLNTVRELMGHASIEQTLIYAHLAPDNLRAAVELL